MQDIKSVYEFHTSPPPQRSDQWQYPIRTCRGEATEPEQDLGAVGALLCLEEDDGAAACERAAAERHEACLLQRRLGALRIGRQEDQREGVLMVTAAVQDAERPPMRHASYER
jgi:hypothetical protein